MNTQKDGAITVLIVEDAEPVAILIDHILANAGYQSQYAENGQIALDMLKQGLRPNLILLDIVMPVMGGYEFLEQISSDDTLGAIPVVMLTGLNDASDVLKSVRRGAVDYCTKPIEPDDLLSTMSRVLAI